MARGAITRRSFLRGSCAAAAALSIPACVFAQAASTKPSDKALRWGVIGTGHRGTIHLGAIKSFPDDMRILGVCDVMENHLAAGAKKAGAGVATVLRHARARARCSISNATGGRGQGVGTR